MGRALDDLYGRGEGEGSVGASANGAGRAGESGGREASQPSMREWLDEIQALFGDEVLAECAVDAARAGRSQALLDLDAESVTPSVDLLQEMLNLAGSLPEARLEALRPLVQKVVDALAKELATRVRPALSGVTLARPTRRPRGPLDLPRTIRRNLQHTRVVDGVPRVIPEELVFRTRGQQAMDWHVVLVVDVSGSMEPSTIYCALMAAILSGVPALTVHFYAFSTHVVDLSDHVEDPLKLLLEVSVGGGTHIAQALRFARERIKVPRRTLVLCVSDFYEGFPIGGLESEVRALVDTGCRPLGLAALDDAGKPRFNTAVAERVAALGMPVAALTPLALARWVGEQVRG